MVCIGLVYLSKLAWGHSGWVSSVQYAKAYNTACTPTMGQYSFCITGKNHPPVVIQYFQKLVEGISNIPDKNSKIGRKFYYLEKMNSKMEGNSTMYSQKLCFDRIFELKKMEGNSTTPKNCVSTEFLHERNTIFFLVFSLI